MAAANPYRLRERNNNEGIIHPSAKTLLSHMVNPIPENILDYVWDYGVLDPSVEKTYIWGMVHSNEVFENPEMMDVFVECISVGQRTMRNVEEGDNSSVSLRDLQRTMKLCKFFQSFLKDRVKPAADILSRLGKFSYWKYKKNPLKNSKERSIRAILLTLAICYLFRLCDKRNKEHLMETFIRIINEKLDKNLDQKWALQSIQDEQDDYLYRIKGVNKLPNDIAMNRSLKENIFTILACILNKIPLFICGKPGSSKTQSFQILKNVMKGVSIEETLFSELPEINECYYQGTLHSTSQGIERLFDKARENAQDNESSNILTVFFFDEIGLAEISKNNPLKVLHNLLEEKDLKVAFVGISNWTLDASKMNRAVYLARWDLDKVDLLEIFEQFETLNQNLLRMNPSLIQTSFGMEPNLAQGDEVFSKLKDVISETYLEFREYQTMEYLHKNFHGTRDFYSLIKFVFRNVRFPKSNKDIVSKKPRSKSKKSRSKSKKKSINVSNTRERDGVQRLLFVLKKAFERNFSGGFDLQGTKSEYAIKKLFLKNLEDKVGMTIEDLGFDQSDFLETESKLDIVKDSLNDVKGRFLLVFVDSDFVEQRIESIVRQAAKQGKVHFLCGSQFDADLENNKYSTEILKDIKLYIEEGFTIIMKDLDVIYGALYDLFNQNYLTVNEKNFCRITFENHKESVAIHDDFRLIILQKSQNEFKDIETSQPAPFLNRFEKLNIDSKDIISKKIQSVVVKVKEELCSSVRSLNLSVEPHLDTLLYDFSEMRLINQIMRLNVEEKSEDFLVKKCLESLIPFYSFQMLLIKYFQISSNYSEVAALEKAYFESHSFDNLPEFLEKTNLTKNDALFSNMKDKIEAIRNSKTEFIEEKLKIKEEAIRNKIEKNIFLRKSVVFTKTNYMDFQREINAEVIRMEEANKQGQNWLENRLMTFFNKNSPFSNFVIFVETFGFWENVAMVRHLINQLEKKMGLYSLQELTKRQIDLKNGSKDKLIYKHVCFVIHYNEKLSSRKKGGRGKILCLWQNDQGWETYAIDSLTNSKKIEKLEDFKKDVLELNTLSFEKLVGLDEALEKSCQIFNYEMNLKDSLKYVDDLKNFWSQNELGKKIFRRLFKKISQLIGKVKGDWRKSVIQQFGDFDQEKLPSQIYQEIKKGEITKFCKFFLQDLDGHSPLLTIRGFTENDNILNSIDLIKKDLYKEIFQTTTLNLIDFHLEAIINFKQKNLQRNSVYRISIPFLKKYLPIFVKEISKKFEDEIRNMPSDFQKNKKNSLEYLNKLYGKINERLKNHEVYNQLLKYFSREKLIIKIKKRNIKNQDPGNVLKKLEIEVFLDLVSDVCNLVLEDGRNYSNKAQINRIIIFLIRKEAEESFANWSLDELNNETIIKSFIYFLIFLIRKKSEIKMALGIIKYCNDEDLSSSFHRNLEFKSKNLIDLSFYMCLGEGLLRSITDFLKMYLPPYLKFLTHKKGTFLLEMNAEIEHKKLLLRKIKKYYLEQKRKNKGEEDTKKYDQKNIIEENKEKFKDSKVKRKSTRRSKKKIIEEIKENKINQYEEEETRIVGTFITKNHEKMDVLLDYLVFLLEVVQMDLKVEIDQDVIQVVGCFFETLQSNREKSIIQIFFENAEFYMNENDYVFDMEGNFISSKFENDKFSREIQNMIKKEQQNGLKLQKWIYVLYRILEKKFNAFIKLIKKNKTFIQKRDYSVENCKKKNAFFLVQALLYELKINKCKNPKFIEGAIKEIVNRPNDFSGNLNLVSNYLVLSLKQQENKMIQDILNSVFQECENKNLFQTIFIDGLSCEPDLIKKCIMENKTFKVLHRLKNPEKIIERTIKNTVNYFHSYKPFEKMTIIAFIRLSMLERRPFLYSWIEQDSFKSMDSFFLLSKGNFEIFSPLRTFFIQNLNAVQNVYEYENKKKRKIIPLRVMSNHNFEVYSKFPDNCKSLMEKFYSYNLEDEGLIIQVIEKLDSSNSVSQYMALEFLINKIYLTHLKSDQHSQNLKDLFSNISIHISKIKSNFIKEFVKNLFLNFPNKPNLQINCSMKINRIQMKLLVVKMLSNLVTMPSREEDLFYKFLSKIRNNNKSLNFLFPFNYNEEIENSLIMIFGLASSQANSFYKCSCGFIYGIGNCGKAWMESKCPECGLTIGGRSHKIAQREGHVQINESEIFEKHRAKLLDYSIRYHHHDLFPKNKKENIKQKALHEGYLFRVMHLYSHVFYLALIYLTKTEKGYKRFLKQLTRKNNNMKLTLQEKEEQMITCFESHIQQDLYYMMDYLRLSEPPFDYLCSLILSIRESHSNLYNYNVKGESNQNFFKFVSSAELQKLLKFELYMTNQVKMVLENFEETKDFVDHFKQEIQKDQSKNDDFKNDWILNKSTFEKIQSQNNNGMLIQNLRLPRIFDFNDFTSELNERTGGDKYPFLKFYIAHKELIDKIIKQILEVHLKLARYFNDTYAFCFTKEHLRFLKIKHLLNEYSEKELMQEKEFENFKDAGITLLSVKQKLGIKKDKKLANLYKEFVYLWELILRLQNKFPEVFSFNFECHQGVEMGVNQKKLKDEEIDLIYFVAITNSEDLNMMLTIFQTCAKFQNKLLEEFILSENSESQIEDVPLAYASSFDFVSLPENFLEDLVNLYAFNEPSFNNASRINFNFQKIEEILKLKLGMHMKRLLYEREHMESFPIKGETDRTTCLLADLQSVVKCSHLPEDSLKKLESFSIPMIRNLEDEIGMILFYILRSGIRDPHFELVKLAIRKEIKISQEIKSLNIDLGMIYDFYQKIQLKLSYWKFNNQVSSILKVSLEEEEIKDLIEFKQGLSKNMLESLTKYLRLYVNQKCTQDANSLLNLNLFEFMSYSDIDFLDISCFGTEVTLTLPERSVDDNDNLEHGVFTFNFKKVLTHNKVFEVLQILEA